MAFRSIPVPRTVLVSCEHGGNRIPPRYQQLFEHHHELLRSHRGYDLGALWLARRFAREFDAPLYAATVSRLLVDLNRSPHNPRVFSGITRPLDPAERDRIMRRHYRPHRERVETRLRELIANGKTVVHLAIHTFTPILDGRVRNADIGLLYDPRRSTELEICTGWQRAIGRMSPALRVRRNYPYRGAADGLTTYLRTQLPPRKYAGIELEVNQRFVKKTGTIAAGVCNTLLSIQF